MRLVDTLAARRIIYPRAIETMPDIMVIDVAPPFAAAGLPLGRYYPIILENEAEQQELDAFLAADRDEPVVPDLLDRRPSNLTANRIIVSRYAPPEQDWPWVLVCYWPAVYAAQVCDDGTMFARGRYTTEIFRSADEMDVATRRILATLEEHCSINVRELLPIAPDTKAPH